MIYIPLWLDLLSASASATATAYAYLHSTMVRFIIANNGIDFLGIIEFTFHYG